MSENGQELLRSGSPQSESPKAGMPTTKITIFLKFLLMTGTLGGESMSDCSPDFWQALLPTGLRDEGCWCLRPNYQLQHSRRIQNLHSM